jgi:hypothetical protein
MSLNQLGSNILLPFVPIDTQIVDIIDVKFVTTEQYMHRTTRNDANNFIFRNGFTRFVINKKLRLRKIRPKCGAMMACKIWQNIIYCGVEFVFIVAQIIEFNKSNNLFFC